MYVCVFVCGYFYGCFYYILLPKGRSVLEIYKELFSMYLGHVVLRLLLLNS